MVSVENLKWIQQMSEVLEQTFFPIQMCQQRDWLKTIYVVLVSRSKTNPVYKLLDWCKQQVYDLIFRLFAPFSSMNDLFWDS